MSEAELPITWLTARGVVHKARGPQVQLALDGFKVSYGHSFVVDGDCVVCAAAKQTNRVEERVMAYSLETGAELWPEAVDGGSILGVVGVGADAIVWVTDGAYSITSDGARCIAYRIASGAAVVALPLEHECAYAVVAAGPWKGHMLTHNCEHVTLYAPGTAKPVWQVAADSSSLPGRILTTKGEWFCLDGRGACRLYSLSDGRPVPSVLDQIPHDELPELLAVYDPEHMLAFTTHYLCDGLYQHFVAVGRELVAGDSFEAEDCELHVMRAAAADTSATTATEMIVYPYERIQIVRSSGAVIDTRPAPGVVAAWLDAAAR